MRATRCSAPASARSAYFTVAYLRGYRRGGRREALFESTRAHAAYNATIVLIVLLTLAWEEAFRRG